MSKAIGPTPPCRIIILGALSAIAKSSARVWAQRGAHLMLVARDGARLATLAADLQMRGASQVQTMTLDLATSDTETSFAAMVAALGAVDAVLLAYGTLGEQEPAEERLSDASTSQAQLSGASPPRRSWSSRNTACCLLSVQWREIAAARPTTFTEQRRADWASWCRASRIVSLQGARARC